MDLPAAARREYGLDWLRVIAFLILIGYHSGMFFVSWDWHIKNPQQSESIEWIMLFFNRWRLPLLFFISGAGVFFSLRRRSFGRFAAERLRRLLIPLAFAMLVIVPPQIYFERLYRHQTAASYWEFWKTVFDLVPYPAGSLSWHHLWFVAYILVYSLISIPLFAWLKGPAGRRAIDALARAAERPGVIYLYNLPNIAAALWLGPKWPTTHNLIADWANFTGSLLTFLWGFVICGHDGFLELVQRRRREFLSVGAAMTIVQYALLLSGAYRNWGAGQRLVISTLVNSLLGMGAIFAAVGYSRAWLNRESSLLRYATRAVYPFYMVHQTITIALAYPMVGWNTPISVKLPLLFLGTFLGSWAVFELVRRNAVTRALMGMTH